MVNIDIIVRTIGTRKNEINDTSQHERKIKRNVIKKY